ncbi:MAG: hypothetical protein DRI95_15275 [Bacteroidetes bacterium]|nr:MAG: hypothetical protein DRI95_15275 [Bacteroidota bacterium]
MMKSFILIGALFLIVSCSSDKEKSKKSRERVSDTRKTVSGKQNDILKTSKPKIIKSENFSNLSENVISNVNIFKSRITPRKKSSLETEIDKLDVSNLTLAEAKVLLNKYKNQSGPLAFKISIKCRDFDVGNYFYKNLYEEYKGDPYLITIGMYWGNFATRHAKPDVAKKIFNKAINDVLKLNDVSFLPCIADVMNCKVETLNMAGEYKESSLAAKEFYEFVIKNKKLFNNPEVYEELGYLYYVQELYNNEQYDEALELIEKYKKANAKYANNFSPDIDEIKQKGKSKIQYSSGYGKLAK